ncbi:DUF7264 domain-containing protein [Segniliparus rugosus]|uniref:LtfC/p132/Gp6 beta-sandwich domain-containing protein n=1 Tax=Segniliparus rugosus (strain ATCC BAA-974 / DSM 45345 / CCUG 50838 / CIP 108380 / JCM 13579 / CDC 945) TaxID=679197 RepID=E5XRU2_SEGRC|nr:hypothetical protein [Segniliparus rugosus]EFV12957.1 hypothetical protein HMPREF9336_02214 [Segniliparus rugosus ATCC BAA-974]
MSVVGVELEPDPLVLTRFRDFRFMFENLDENRLPTPFPPGKLYFELDTGGAHNAMQEVSVIAASGGTYKLGVFGEYSPDIDYYDATTNPYGMQGDITDALEAIPSVGAGNVKVGAGRLIPVWEITLTLNAAHNEIQEVKLYGNPTGGTFRLNYSGQTTADIPFGADAATVQSKLSALSTIGAGNAAVTKIDNYTYRVEFVGALAGTDVQQILGFGWGLGWGLTGGLFPGVRTSTITNGLAQLNEQLMNLINTTVNGLFNSFDSLLGVDIEFSVSQAKNAKLTVTSLKSYDEQGLITFGVNVTSNMIESVINSVAQLVGLFSTVHVDFYWNHVYQVEFVGALSDTYVPPIAPDTTALTGVNNEQRVEVSVIRPGKARMTIWPFTIDGAKATIKVESEQVDLIEPRTRWQLVFLPEGEPAGGDPVARGRVMVQE